MTSSKKHDSSTPSLQSYVSITNDNEKENRKKEVQTTNQQQCLQIVNDGESPCHSKSVSPHRHRVRFSTDAEDKQGVSVLIQEFIDEPLVAPSKSCAEELPPPLTPLPSAFRYLEQDHHHDEYRLTESLGTGFSDSILTLPNLPTCIEAKPDHNENQNDKNTTVDEQVPSDTVSRKCPNINFIHEAGSDTSDDKRIEFHYRKNEDENNNPILWPTESGKKLIKHASYIFHKDRRSDLERLTRLMPRGRELVIFNVFTDVARLLGFRKRGKHVAFPEEFLEKYEQQGDVAGKDRFVPASKQPYKGLPTTSKKRKLSAVYSSWTIKSTEFVPRVDRVDDVNKCEFCCEKYFIACDCCRRLDKKPDLTTVMDGYLTDLNLASAFLHGHATKTFESAMSNLEFVKFHESQSSVTAQTPWTMNYSKQHLGVLSGSIWVFTYCIRTIIQQTRDQDAHIKTASLPSESSFRKIMEQYATICLVISENVKLVLQYGHNFYNFCKEVIRIMKVLQVHLGFKRDIRLKLPLKRGDGLHLNRMLSKLEITKQKAVDVNVMRINSIQEADQEAQEIWKDFVDLSGSEKAACLRNLLYVTTQGMNTVQTQIRFLMDDIVDSVKDPSEADLLFVLADMYDRIKFLENVGRKHVRSEFEQISRATAEFCNDIQSFVDYGQHIIKRFVELRDMVHLSYEFFVNGLKLESVSDMVPTSTFKKKRRKGCCGGTSSGQKGLKKSVANFYPKYKMMDFFRVYYMDAVKCRAEINANRFIFHIDMSKQTLKAVIPKGKVHTWGEGDAPSPRFSFEEYVDEKSDVDEDAAGDKEKVEMPKPILVSHSPRGSIDLTEETTKSTEDATQPPKIVERGSQDSSPEDKPNDKPNDKDKHKENEKIKANNKDTITKN